MRNFLTTSLGLWLMNTRLRACSVLLISFLLFTLPPSLAYPEGIGQQGDKGCACHGAARELKTQALIDGLPDRFNFSETYNLTIWMNSSIIGTGANQGGFLFWYSDGLASGSADTREMDGHLTHSEAGNDQRGWMIQWIAPERDDIQVDFQFHANAVNGDGETTGDAWSSKVVSVPGENFTGELKDAKVPKNELGIPFIGVFTTIAAVLFAARRIQLTNSI